MNKIHELSKKSNVPRQSSGKTSDETRIKAINDGWEKNRCEEQRRGEYDTLRQVEKMKNMKVMTGNTTKRHKKYSQKFW